MLTFLVREGDAGRGFSLQETCEPPEPLSGLGECRVTLPSSYFVAFARNARVTLTALYDNSFVALSIAGVVLLSAVPQRELLSEAGMRYSATDQMTRPSPESPQFPLQ